MLHCKLICHLDNIALSNPDRSIPQEYWNTELPSNHQPHLDSGGRIHTKLPCMVLQTVWALQHQEPHHLSANMLPEFLSLANQLWTLGSWLPLVSTCWLPMDCLLICYRKKAILWYHVVSHCSELLAICQTLKDQYPRKMQMQLVDLHLTNSFMSKKYWHVMWVFHSGLPSWAWGFYFPESSVL